MEDVKEGKDYRFPAEEDEILKLWEKLDAFKEQLRRSEGRPEYIFYDGPPFATGLPHYGHLLAGTIKVSYDAIPNAPSGLCYGINEQPWKWSIRPACHHPTKLHSLL